MCTVKCFHPTIHSLSDSLRTKPTGGNEYNGMLFYYTTRVFLRYGYYTCRIPTIVNTFVWYHFTVKKQRDPHCLDIQVPAFVL